MIRYVDSQINESYVNLNDKICTIQTHIVENNKTFNESIENFVSKITHSETTILGKLEDSIKCQDEKLEKTKQEILKQKSEDIVEALNKINSFKSKFSDLLKRVVNLESKVEYFKVQTVSSDLQKRVYGIIDNQNKQKDVIKIIKAEVDILKKRYLNSFKETRNLNDSIHKDLESFKSTLNVKIDSFDKEYEGLSRELERYQSMNRTLMSEFSKKIEPKDMKTINSQKSRFLSPQPMVSKTVIEFPNIKLNK